MRRTVISAVVGGALTASLALVPSSAAAADPPPNDDFANGQVILSAGQSVAGSNVGATEQGLEGEPEHAGMPAYHSVWWSWTATDSGDAKIITCNSDFDTRLGVYTGDAVNALTPVASALDTNGGECPNLWAGVTFAATAGTTYRIAVDTEGDLSGEGTGPPLGDIALTLTAPPGSEEPPPTDDDTNPGTAADEEPYTFTMLRLKPLCAEEGSKSLNDCPRNATNLRFYSAEPHQTWENRQDSVVRWVEKLRNSGADINLVMVPKPSHVMDGAVMKYLRAKGRGGEILTQNVTPRQKVTTTSANPLLLKVSYFDPAEDQKILDATLNALQKAGEDRKEVKSPCEFIDSNASPNMIETKLAQSLGSGTMTQKRAGEILKGFGCGYEVTYPDGRSAYEERPGLTTDTVLDVVGVTKSRNVIHLRVGLPVAQDFVFVISEEPEFAGTDILGLGLDGKLTANRWQVNRITVQVIERSTGRLVPGVKLDFFDNVGNPVTETTNQWGEWTFTSLMSRPGRYSLKATYVGGDGSKMVGFRSIDVVDRPSGSFVTMSGRTMSWNGGAWSGTQADVDAAKSLVIVPAIMGTGIAGAPTAPPDVQQISAAVPSGSSFVIGDHNAVYLPNDTNYLVGSASGLVTIGGGDASQVASRTAARSWPNPFQQVANWLVGILSGLQEATESGEGTVAEKTSATDKQSVAETTSALINNGASPAGNGLISDKGLGLIGQAGGNLIGQAGGNVIGTGGLNLIGQAGGNFTTAKLISDKGLGRVTPSRSIGSGIHIGSKNVISLEKDMMPVYGGNDIALQ